MANETNQGLSPTVVVALLSLLGVIGAAVISNWDKLRPAPVSATTPMNIATAPIDLTGSWSVAGTGTVTNFKQHGESFTATSKYNATTVVLEGMLKANTIEWHYDIMNGEGGSCRGKLVDHDNIFVDCVSSVTAQAYPAVLHRIG